mmetsp:Transcript_13994/g.35322  ORF Transcript_13994/g.35322 Transcript_13994/m.35322 type:complete len:92 (+) Transcript_13994:455-730(+)
MSKPRYTWTESALMISAFRSRRRASASDTADLPTPVGPARTMTFFPAFNTEPIVTSEVQWIQCDHPKRATTLSVQSIHPATTHFILTQSRS